MKQTLQSRRDAYLEEIADLNESIETYESGHFKMQGKTGDGPWIDQTDSMLANCKRVKATYENLIADIDRRLEAGED